MIDPGPADVGRVVLYREPYEGAPVERGFITSYNSKFVFVRFGVGETSAACSRVNLEWEVG